MGKMSEGASSNVAIDGKQNGDDWLPSIFDGRIGKRMETQNQGHWRKWKRVQIVEKGGLEGLWKRKEEKEKIDQNRVDVGSETRGPEAAREVTSEKSGVEEEKPEGEEKTSVDAESKGEVEGKNNKKGKGKERHRGRKPQRDIESIDRENVIYLTADSENTVEELEDGKVYVLGGIADRNRYKVSFSFSSNPRLSLPLSVSFSFDSSPDVSLTTLFWPNQDLCANKARSLGLKTARLPIDAKFMVSQSELRSRKVLTVNQVLEILVGWNETKDWKLAIERGLPVRKLDENSEEKGKGKGKRKREEGDCNGG